MGGRSGSIVLTYRNCDYAFTPAACGRRPRRTSYVPQTTCDPVEKPGITAFKQLVAKMNRPGVDWGSVRNCTDDGISEHLEGRAWDWACR